MKCVFRVGESVTAEFLYSEEHSEPVRTLLDLLNEKRNLEDSNSEYFTALEIHRVRDKEVVFYDRGSTDMIVRLRDNKPEEIIAVNIENKYTLTDLLNQEVKEEGVRYEILNVNGRIKSWANTRE